MQIVVLDNSDQEKFVLDSRYVDGVHVIDNTSQKFLHTFDIMRMLSLDKQILMSNRCASLKHCISIDYLISICPTQKLLIVDSDAMVKRKLDFIESDAITVADLETTGVLDKRKHPRRYCGFTRFAPYIQLFNVDKMRMLGLKYFDFKRMQGIDGFRQYDTGASFYEDVVLKAQKYDVIDYTQYIDHLEHGSWKYEQQ